ncbi:NACHT, LRR and PYD domains-containing protein 1-like isoform X2 [Malaclemys terrapin pileata]|uniref:NACHT, LRR and PYD domains-containing protein 1-like isoform X2 n=1 Tax=Malaclemys terrapin pileata TaxID=2991368 RepID=UPI0023A799EA|nr:NACHT, LRR and PYD domains-containing protein 1-like isoform X2 [Malaclemys terrapin pileata]
MERAERELLETLAMLGERELQRFKDKLSEIQPKEGYQQLPSGSLRNAAPPALADLLLLFYGTDYGAEVAAEVLRAIDQGALAERIETLIDALECEKQKQHPFVGGGFMFWKCTLNDEQYQTIRAEKTSQEKMQKLYELVPGWNKWQKDRLYQALKETNRDLVEELEGGHFVDLYREQLIQRVSEVDGVLKLLRGHTLTREQYKSISTRRSNVEKMQKLYELVPSWGREQKDRLYRVLYITNGALLLESAEEHFVERHREQLIQRASSVDTILDMLHRDKLRYDEQLRKTEQNELWMEGHSGHMEAPHDQISTEELTSASGVRRRSEDATSGSWGKDRCDLCHREKDFAEEVKPEILPGPEENPKLYRVHFPQAGSFRCSETELGFEVWAAVTLRYNYESWRCHQTELDMQQWMIAGPLFNIWAEPAGAVAALHLPHFMCFAGGEAGVSQMRMAHFVDGRMTLEEPTRVMPFHAVLEDPRFSFWGAILKIGISMLSSPIHGITLLYRALRAENITLHLYLIPDILPLRKVIDDNERKYKSIRVRKPPTTKPLTYGSHYAVSSTSDVEITPEVTLRTVHHQQNATQEVAQGRQ